MLFSNELSVTSSVCVLPGINDHKVVVGQINGPKHQVAKLQPRKVYLYAQGGYETMADELFNYFTEFQELLLCVDIYILA